MNFNPLDYPVFLAPKMLSEVSAWVQHIPFAFALTQMLRPKRFVELGTHAGDSYCAFCQAVSHLQLSTQCFAVDTWRGDFQAGYYDSSILDSLRAHHDPLYGGFSRLMQCEFDRAAGEFEAGSIDLLHIDGLHTYEAVKHDYQTWLPKLRSAGVILFHDTNTRGN